MIATREATEVAYLTDVDDDAFDRLMGDAPKPTHTFFADAIFGTATECAEDALLIKRLSLIVVPFVLLICLLTQLLAYAG